LGMDATYTPDNYGITVDIEIFQKLDAPQLP
jgi:hypothetical protein